MADQERTRYFRNPKTFLLAAVDRLKERYDWDVVSWHRVIPVRFPPPPIALAASVTRVERDKLYPTLIWVNPRQPRLDRNFALGWSVGIVILTENLSNPQCSTGPRSMTFAPLPLETPEFTIADTEDYRSRAAAFAACLLVNEAADDPDKEAEIASRLRVPRHLVGLYTRLQQIEEGERYAFIGVNPTEWADGLKINLRR